MAPTFELVICITSSALFDSIESRTIWTRDGYRAYQDYQRAHVGIPLKPGVGFPLVRSLLALNEAAKKELVEVVLVSQKDADCGERVRQSIYHYGLRITRMSFTGGTCVTKYLAAWHCDLFLSADENQVRTVLLGNNPEAFTGIAAALICQIVDETTSSSQSISNDDTKQVPSEAEMIATAISVDASMIDSSWPEDQVRIAFDGDGVLFSDEAERVFKTKGLDAFYKFERENGHVALPKGPMHIFALKLQRVRQGLGEDDKWRLRTFLVTARNDIGNIRVFNTLKEWGLQIDEMHFLGGIDKTPFLRSINPAIFFDDSRENIDRAKQYVPSAQVVYGVNNIQRINLTESITSPINNKD
jgi:5'-nucleotidase